MNGTVNQRATHEYSVLGFICMFISEEKEEKSTLLS